MHQHLVQQQNKQQRQRVRPVPQQKCRHGHGERDVHRGKQPLDSQEIGEIFGQQLGVLTDVAVIETLNPEIVQDLKKVGEVEQREIGPIMFSHPILHPEVDAKYEYWLYQEVDKDEE